MFSPSYKRFATLSNVPLKSIKLRTCVGVYEKLKAKYPKIYKNPCPNNGFDVEVSFLDTLSQTPDAKQTVVALHGGIGDYTAYKQLVDYFVQRNVRVIVPKFPTFELTRKTLYYWHSTDEKACVVRDLLRELGIQKVDLLTAHSQGSFTAAALADRNAGVRNPPIKSIAFLAPYYVVQFPYWKAKLFLALSSPVQSEIWWKFAELICIYKLPIFGFKFNSANEHFQLSTTLLDNQDTPEWIGRLRTLAFDSDIPVLVLYGTREKVVEPRFVKNLLDKLNIDYTSLKTITALGNLSDKILESSRVNAFLIDGAGHFVHQHCPDVCNTLLTKLMDSAK